MHVTYTIRICVDCLFLIANGAVSGPAGDDLTAEHHAKMKAIWGDLLCHMVIACGGEDEGDCGFDWSACGGCGSSLGGDRHQAAVLEPTPVSPQM